jgi:hypothetical protein
MKRLVLIIMVLFLLVDIVEDGNLGNVKTGPQAAVSIAFSIFPHHPSRQGDSQYFLPSPEWRDPFTPGKYQPVVQEGQQAPKLITFCENSSSGGIPL